MIKKIKKAILIIGIVSLLISIVVFYMILKGWGFLSNSNKLDLDSLWAADFIFFKTEINLYAKTVIGIFKYTFFIWLFYFIVLAFSDFALLNFLFKLNIVKEARLRDIVFGIDKAKLNLKNYDKQITELRNTLERGIISEEEYNKIFGDIDSLRESEKINIIRLYSEYELNSEYEALSISKNNNWITEEKLTENWKEILDQKMLKISFSDIKDRIETFRSEWFTPRFVLFVLIVPLIFYIPYEINREMNKDNKTKIQKTEERERIEGDKTEEYDTPDYDVSEDSENDGSYQSDTYSSDENYTIDESREVKIGQQIWLIENLNVEVFRNGDPIPYAKSHEDWLKAVENGEPAYCYYDDNPYFRLKYGKLYNYYAVNDPRGIAPSGYHIPSKEEWMELTSCLINDFENVSSFDAYDLMSTYGWQSPSSNKATNNTGFSALPGGFRGFKETTGFFGEGFYTYFWSSTEHQTEAWALIIQNGFYFFSLSRKDGGFSVRCVRS